MTSLLARYAEAAFWMARYMERAENMARILDVNETFSRDSRGAQNWRSIIELYADDEAFFASHDEASAKNVIQFYLLDDEHPGSVRASVRMARENARSLRPWISTEMWVQLNVFYNRLRALGPDDVSTHRLARLCNIIKESVQTHTGITEGTFYRDESWYFYRLGRQIERADQTTRLLDVKYHLLLPDVASVGSSVDLSQWNALLRSTAGFHAFRRVHPRGLSPDRVASFLLFNRGFPRSLRVSVAELAFRLGDLREKFDLEGGARAQENLESLRRRLDEESIEAVIAGGLHEYLDAIQLELIAIGAELGRDFFGWAPLEAQAQGQA
ncbi:MAG: alpha-E domain-containing protein [Pseudomonadota bacterium]